MTPQRYISYVIQYANVAKNYIGENSLDSQTIALSINQISTTALLAIDRINKGDITTFPQLMVACSPIGDALFEQIVNDKDYTDYMNEQDAKQRGEHELPY
jgi:hypothetical protein